MPDKKDTIEPIVASFEDVVKALVSTPHSDAPEGPGKGNKEVADTSLPTANWGGLIDLGGNEIDCYVLGDGTRVLSSGSTTKAIANVERGSLQDYIGQKALNQFIDIDKINSKYDFTSKSKDNFPVKINNFQLDSFIDAKSELKSNNEEN